MNEVYEIAIFGELTLDARQLDAWRELPLDVDAFADSPEAFQGSELGDGDEPVTIGTWIDDCTRYERGGKRTFIHFDITPTCLRLRALVDEPEYDRYRRQLAAMFRLAGRVGGRGELTFASAPEERVAIGYHVRVDGEASDMRLLGDDELARVRSDRGMQSVLRRARDDSDAARESTLPVEPVAAPPIGVRG
jgi:hypothetical protein